MTEQVNQKTSSDHKEPTLNDKSIIEYLRRNGDSSIAELVEFGGVTATAIRQRLSRLMEQGLVVRHAETAGRGRPSHKYSLSQEGVRASGNNYEDLATVLWSEVRSVRDPEVRQGLLKRIVVRLADIYRDRVVGDTVNDRMQSLAGLMRERDLSFDVDQPNSEGQLPVLTALACPYPDLAEQDRGICSMEKMLFAEVLGDGLRLTNCRLDGAAHCTFEVSPR